MTPDLLRRVGEALYSERWQTALATALGYSDRTMRRWLAGDSQMPDTLCIDLFNLCLTREEALRALRNDLVDL
jgi:hypothetical protein